MNSPNIALMKFGQMGIPAWGRLGRLDQDGLQVPVADAVLENEREAGFSNLRAPRPVKV